MVAASGVPLSCGCADERHLGTRCPCMVCVEDPSSEHPPTPCPLTPEQRPEAIRERAYIRRAAEIKARVEESLKIADDIAGRIIRNSAYEYSNRCRAVAVVDLAKKLYDELKAAEAQAKAEVDAIQVSASAKTTESVNAPNLITPQFRTWKTIKLGTGLKTVDDFRQALKKAGHRISDWANDILGQRAFGVADQEIEADLVVVSVAELGFPNGATRQDIYRRAQELGLELCPAEVGPQLRLQYPNQPNGEWLAIGMEPIAGSAGRPEVFSVARGGISSLLDGIYGNPVSFWLGNSRWVFLRRR